MSIHEPVLEWDKLHWMPSKHSFRQGVLEVPVMPRKYDIQKGNAEVHLSGNFTLFLQR